MRYQKGTSGEGAPSLTWARVPRHCWARRGRLPGLRPGACVFLLRRAPRIEPSALVSGNNGSVVRAVRSIHSPFKAPAGGHGVWAHTFQRASLQVGTRIALGGPLEASRAWPPDLLSLPVTTFFFSAMAINGHVSKVGALSVWAQSEDDKDQRPRQEHGINLCYFKLWRFASPDGKT